MPLGIQGENVRISLKTSTASTSSVAVQLFDPNGNLRPLASYERLSIDSLVADVPSGITADLLDSPGGTSTDTQAVILFSFSATAPEFHTDKEGMDVSTGVTPSLLTSGAGTVKLTGVGRIINATTQGVRPSWRESLVGGFSIQP